jgi:hypothetical protein
VAFTKIAIFVTVISASGASPPARARDDGVPLRFGFQLTGHVGSLDDSRGLKTARSAILRKREIDGPILAIGNIKAGTTPRTGADPKCPLSRLKTKNLYGTIS